MELARYKVKKCYDTLDADNEVFDITVRYDGSWQKRGFTSKYGICCCIEILTGLIIDFEVLSKFCNKCEVAKQKISNPEHFKTWYNNHKGVCNQNYVGSSPGMEKWRQKDCGGIRFLTLFFFYFLANAHYVTRIEREIQHLFILEKKRSQQCFICYYI